MSENSTNTELLIQYIDGELEGEQLNSIQKNIDENASIRQELENLQLAREAVKSYGLKNKITTVHFQMMHELKENASSKTGITRKLFQYGLRIAALIIILFGISVLYQYYYATPEKLFSENFHAFALRETRGSSASPIEEAYKNNKINEVIQQFNNLKEPQPEDYFLTGNAFLSTHQPAKAIQVFITLQEKNKTNNTHYFEEDAEYYLALSYLDNNEPVKAVLIFQKIHEDENHPYHNKVSSWFLRKVKRISAEK